MRRTPLYERHIELGAKMTEFAGWEMPVQYESIISEHLTVRNAVGVFDISHMGEIEVSGESARETILRIMPVREEKLLPGKAAYSFLLNENGGVVDDLIIYTFSPREFILVVNAGNIEKDFKWIDERKEKGTSVVNRSEEISAISIQGPKSTELFSKLFNFDLKELKYYSFRKELKALGNETLFVSKTGYTGEIGFEIYATPEKILGIWDTVINLGVKPCGLGARDMLRMEAGMPLYGHELDEETSPIEAGLARFLDTGRDFIGKKALKNRKKLVGLKMLEKGVPRPHQEIFVEERKSGYITSGGYSPYLREYIGMGYLDLKAESKEVKVKIRGKKKKAVIVNLPFYKRRRS